MKERKKWRGQGSFGKDTGRHNLNATCWLYSCVRKPKSMNICFVLTVALQRFCLGLMIALPLRLPAPASDSS